ncbi:MAG TPA: hypothetical protein GXZ90_04575 [Clostridiales bacterium]|nr:hypothetical protein [Clostridiales bacterium]
MSRFHNDVPETCKSKSGNIYIMNYKTKLFIILSMLTLILGACTPMPKLKSYSVREELIDTKKDLDLNKYVDNQLQIIIQSKSYQEANIDQRKKTIEEILIELKNEESIKHFYYNQDIYLFSFEYNDETLGGVKIKDFNTMMN